METSKIIGIAKVCHEANKAYCEMLGDNTQTSWEDAPEWQKESAINGVKYHLENPHSKPSDSHESWLKEKEANGWKYGKVKDAEKKEHPCFVPFSELPKEQQLKDVIFLNIVKLLSNDIEKMSDGYHSFSELYDFRKAYNSALFTEWSKSNKYDIHKSKRHSDGELCFGGGWFIVMAETPFGQISNHYEMEDWNLFPIPEKEKSNPFDGHSSEDVAERLKECGTDIDTFNFICDMSKETKIEKEVVANKTLRKSLDAQLQNLKDCPKSSERSLAITKLQEAIMWLGMDLKRLNQPNPYPQSYNPENTEIEPTTDNLKL